MAIITVLKAGFLFSGRAGSGVIVARLPDGSWSAPSAIVTAGAGVGGQIGAEITDFVFILNNKAAVDSFAQMGSITLGANVSVAAGPLGRNAEGAGTASLKVPQLYSHIPKPRVCLQVYRWKVLRLLREERRIENFMVINVRPELFWRAMLNHHQHVTH